MIRRTNSLGWRGKAALAASVALLAGLVGLGGGALTAFAGGGKDPGRSGEATAGFGHVQLVNVPTRNGRRVAVHIPIDYRSTAGDKAVHRIDRVSVVVSVKTDRGTVRRFTASQFTILDARRSRIHTHPFLGKTAGEVVRAALARGKTAIVRPEAKLVTDTNRDGTDDDQDRLSATYRVSKLTSVRRVLARETDRRSALARAALATKSGCLECNNYGPDACSFEGLDSKCVNVQMAPPPWKAGHDWASPPYPGLKILCPPGYGTVNEAPAVFGGAPLHSVITTSKYWSSASRALTNSIGAYITITDDNAKLGSHPQYYTPVIACCPISEQVDVNCPGG